MAKRKHSDDMPPPAKHIAVIGVTKEGKKPVPFRHLFPNNKSGALEAERDRAAVVKRGAKEVRVVVE